MRFIQVLGWPRRTILALLAGLAAIASATPTWADTTVQSPTPDEAQRCLALQHIDARPDPGADLMFGARIAALAPEVRPLGAQDAAQITELGGTISRATATGPADYAALLPVTRQLLDVYTQTFGPDHPLTATEEGTYGGNLLATRQVKAAEPLLEHAYRTLLAAGGPLPTTVRNNEYVYLAALVGSGRCHEALAVHEDFLRRSDEAQRVEALAASPALTALQVDRCNGVTSQIALDPESETLAQVFSAIGDPPAIRALTPEESDEMSRLVALTIAMPVKSTLPEQIGSLRRQLEILRVTFGVDSKSYAQTELLLGVRLAASGEFDESTKVLQAAVDKFSTLPGGDRSLSQLATAWLAEGLVAVGRCADAAALVVPPPGGPAAAAAPSGAEGYDPSSYAYADAVQTFNEHTFAAVQVVAQGETATSLAATGDLVREAHDKFGDDSVWHDLASVLYGAVLESDGQFQTSEPLLRGAVLNLSGRIQQMPPGLTSLLGTIEFDRDRFAEAAAFLEPAAESVVHGQDAGEADVVTLLSSALFNLDRFDEAETWANKAVALAALSPDMLVAEARADAVLASVAAVRGRDQDAEALLRTALTRADAAADTTPPSDEAQLQVDLKLQLAGLLSERGGNDEAAALAAQARQAVSAVFGDSRIKLLPVDVVAADVRLAQGHYAQAATDFARLCPELDETTGVAGQARILADCEAGYALSLDGPVIAGADRPNEAVAFEAAQRATASAAGRAIAHANAVRVAAGAPAGPIVERYEQALARRQSLDKALSRLIGEAGSTAEDQRRDLGQQREAQDAVVRRTTTEISRSFPLFWDLDSPKPVSLADLQAVAGAGSALLKPDEALVLWMIPPGHRQGLVFAVTQDRSAWAPIGLGGDELDARVARLRAQIDPQGYRVRSAVRDSGSPVSAFDRQASYELYQALLGDPRIQAVIGGKSVLLFVPSGPMTSLPPGILVTAPPPGGPAGDADPAALRATAWLLRDKAVAVLPTVSSLRTLRRLLPARRVRTTDPLLAFADPDLGGDQGAGDRGAGADDGMEPTAAKALRSLPQLSWSLAEGQALQKVLGAGPDSLLLRADASKAELMARNADGRLARVRVLEFATHGLAVGDLPGLAEPALVLAAGARPQDSLLLASEAATLKVNADWVLLSACNTASPDAPEAQGLSGLSRAFFFAGAHSLLISHWRVRDDVAARLIPAMLLAERQDPRLSHAEALRRASLAVLDSQMLDAASPSTWAPFALVGEPER